MNVTISQVAVVAAKSEDARRPFGRRGNERIAAAFAAGVVSIGLLTSVVLGMTATVGSAPAQVILVKR